MIAIRNEKIPSCQSRWAARVRRNVNAYLSDVLMRQFRGFQIDIRLHPLMFF